MKIGNKPRNASIIAFVAIFLALIRCIAEPFRLQHYSTATLGFDVIKPFLVGALCAAIGLAAMLVLQYYKKHIAVILTAAVVVGLLVIIKVTYSIP